MERKLRMYIVKREVLARSIKDAVTAKGIVYEVSLADEKFQPDSKKPIKGFNNGLSKKS